MSDVAVALIAAVAENGVIGAEGDMPWRLSTDLRRFKALTLGHPVVMGRRTYESIGRPLPGRTNVVISTRADFRPDGVTVTDSLETALDHARGAARAAGLDKVFVIGGGAVYAAALPTADELHITHVHAAPEGDTRFPGIDPRLWAAELGELVAAGDRDSAATTYTVYRRRGMKTGR